MVRACSRSSRARPGSFIFPRSTPSEQPCRARRVQDTDARMPPRAPVVWSTRAVGSERLRLRIDERHRELTVQAKLRGRSYRRSRAAPLSDEVQRRRGEFLAALGRLAAFESASI